MLKSEMQHQFWITKKTVQRKLGSKEDEHIISSDAELDAKIEVFKSIAATSLQLSKIIEQYQESLCILSQEESFFGRFLKEAGKSSKTTGQAITNTGKAISYCGQQRMGVRVPLLRLQHEVDVYRNRAVSDTNNTIISMEKERTEYRAALEWMKSASSELDPDTGRGLEKFRTAQFHVRNAKQLFDSLSLDTIQKVDLLAAARCNMFSHVLVSYMSELIQFSQKVNTTFVEISKALQQKPKYDFCVLKDLAQHEENCANVKGNKAPSFDKDQSLFFAEDYMDKNESNANKNKPSGYFSKLNGNLVELCNNSKNDNIMDLYDENKIDPIDNAIMFDESVEALSKICNTKVSTGQTLLSPTKSLTGNLIAMKSKCPGKESSFGVANEKSLKTNPWIKLFADLDPLASLEVFDLKLSGDSKNVQQT